MQIPIELNILFLVLWHLLDVASLFFMLKLATLIIGVDNIHMDIMLHVQTKWFYFFISCIGKTIIGILFVLCYVLLLLLYCRVSTSAQLSDEIKNNKWSSCMKLWNIITCLWYWLFQVKSNSILRLNAFWDWRGQIRCIVGCLHQMYDILPFDINLLA